MKRTSREKARTKKMSGKCRITLCALFSDLFEKVVQRARRRLSSTPTPTTHPATSLSSSSTARTMMTAIFRPPLAPRSTVQVPTTIAPQVALKAHPASILKRPRSPEPHNLAATHEIAQPKRHRTQSATTKENIDKQQRRAEREARENEFRAKYTKAFPSWTFYFDTNDTERDSLAPRVLQLDGVRVLTVVDGLRF